MQHRNSHHRILDARRLPGRELIPLGASIGLILGLAVGLAIGGVIVCVMVGIAGVAVGTTVAVVKILTASEIKDLHAFGVVLRDALFGILGFAVAALIGFLIAGLAGLIVGIAVAGLYRLVYYRIPSQRLRLRDASIYALFMAVGFRLVDLGGLGIGALVAYSWISLIEGWADVDARSS